jgi:hypothetical protein
MNFVYPCLQHIQADDDWTTKLKVIDLEYLGWSLSP